MMFLIIILGLTIISLILCLYRHRLKSFFEIDEVNQKIKNHPEKKQIKQIELFLETLYERVDSVNLSRQDRKALKEDSDEFTCGEIEFLSFFTILDKINPQPGEIFYDLGSASGKAVFAAALFFDFSKACGVEVLPSLYSLAQSQVDKAKALIKLDNQLPETLFSRRLNSIQFLNKNIFDFDFSDGDIIFINATCFSYYHWENLVSKLSTLKKGSRVLVTSKKIVSPSFHLVSQSFERMSWGMNSMNIYKKI